MDDWKYHVNILLTLRLSPFTDTVNLIALLPSMVHSPSVVEQVSSPSTAGPPTHLSNTTLSRTTAVLLASALQRGPSQATAQATPSGRINASTSLPF
jgi:hypothetical protein